MPRGFRKRRIRTGLWAGLATIALVVAILGAGAGTASATLLCDVPSCVPLETYPANTAIAASLAEGTQAALLSSAGTVTCKKGSIAGKTTAEGGKPLPLEVSELGFGECSRSGSECTATTVSLPTSPSFEASGEGNGTLSLTGGEVKFKCGFFINCTYATPTLQAEGGNPASLSAEEVTLTKISGSLCPSTAKLDVTYTVSEPAPAYLAM
jgi:hypothetical protein